MDSPTEPDEGIFDNSTALTIFWSLAAVFFLCCPILANATSRRSLCDILRLRRPTTNENRDWRQAAADHIERSRHRSTNGQSSLSLEEEEEIRQLFLIQQLSQYTMTISSKDVKERTSLKDGDAKQFGGEADIETGNGTLPSPVHKALEVDGDDDLEEDHELVVDEFEPSDNRIVTVIAAGQAVLPMDETCKTREVANGCAICLCEYDGGDQITWSANKECPHVFHSDCIIQWMLALGRKEQKKRRKNPELSTGDPIKDVVSFPMLCPCCRQVFVAKPESTDFSEASSREGLMSSETTESSTDGELEIIETGNE